MKLLYLINGLGRGGAERSLVELLPFFLSAGVETTVVCLRNRVEYAETARARGARVEFLPSRGVRAVTDIRRFIRALRPSVVHTTIFEADIAGRVAAAGLGVPVLTSLVNTAYDPVRLLDPNVRRLSLSIYREVDGFTARRLTNHFHAITEAVKESAVRDLRVDPNRITVIPRGRDASLLGRWSEDRRERVRRDLGIPHDAPVLVNVARHEYQKGQTHLLDAMIDVVRAHPSAQLLILGREGLATTELRAKAEQLALTQNVQFLGFRTDVPDLLSAADVFVFPSLYEGLGGAVIEAMALNLPVVASDIGALREVVDAGASGFLVPPGKSPELAHRITTLIDQPDLRRRMGSHGRKLFEERFTIDRSAQHMIDLYRRLAPAS